MGELPIGNGFYQDESAPLSNQECVNFIIEVPQAPSLSKVVLKGAPGILQVTTTGAAGADTRGIWEKGNIAYVVNGSKLYSIDRTVVLGVTSYSYTELGTVEGSGRVWMASNDTQLCILNPGGKGYIYNENAGTPFLEITDPDFRANGNPMTVKFVDGYFLFSTDEKKNIVSAINDGMTYDALDFGSAESDPDEIVGNAIANNQVYSVGRYTTEGFQNIGGSGYPFQRNNIFLDKGSLAPFSIISTNQTFFMLGGGEKEGPAIWQFTGANYEKKSTIAIDNLLASLTDTEISNVYAMSYGQKGHYFVCFTLPDTTIVFDLVSQKWTERKSTINEVQSKWRVAGIVQSNNEILVGDSRDGRIGILDTNEYGEYGEDIVSTFSTQPFANMGGISLPMIELTCEAGVGNETVEDPEVSMALSRDGHNFNYERSRKLGKEGAHKQRQIWRQNGKVSRFAVLKFRISDQVKKTIIKLEAK